MLAFRTEYLDTNAGGHIQPSGSVHSKAVSSTLLPVGELCKIPAPRGGAIGLDIVRQKELTGCVSDILKFSHPD